MSRRVRPASSPAPAPRRCSGSHYLPHCYQAATGSGCPQQEVMTPRRGARPPTRWPIAARSSAAGGVASGRAPGTGSHGDAPHVTGPTFLRHFEWWRRARVPRIVGTFAFAFRKLKDVTSDSCRPFPGSWRRDAPASRGRRPHRGRRARGLALVDVADSADIKAGRDARVVVVMWEDVSARVRVWLRVTVCDRVCTERHTEGGNGSRTVDWAVNSMAKNKAGKRGAGGRATCRLGTTLATFRAAHGRPLPPGRAAAAAGASRARQCLRDTGDVAPPRARCHACTTLPKFPRCCPVSCPDFLLSVFSRNTPTTLASSDPTSPARCPLHLTEAVELTLPVCPLVTRATSQLPPPQRGRP